MIDTMDTSRRISLAFLLILLLIGVAGHWSSPASDSHHASESACAFHAGILIPEIPQAQAVEEHISARSDQAIPIALCLIGKISHPPTL